MEINILMQEGTILQGMMFNKMYLVVLSSILSAQEMYLVVLCSILSAQELLDLTPIYLTCNKLMTD
jgi:hypothetical protein